MNDKRTEDRDRAYPSSPQRCLQFTCPTCKRRVRVCRDDPSKLPPLFPFCSERCKMVDLGAWLDADYRIASGPDEESEQPAHEDSSADTADSSRQSRRQNPVDDAPDGQ